MNPDRITTVSGLVAMVAGAVMLEDARTLFLSDEMRDFWRTLLIISTSITTYFINKEKKK